MVCINKVVSITEANSIKSKREYEAEIEKRMQRKQVAIDKIVNKLQLGEIDDKTMFLISDIYFAIATSWAIGGFKKKHAEQVKPKPKTSKPRRRA